MSNQNDIKIDFDRIAELEQNKWNHNNHYYNFLLRKIGKRRGDSLEIGCGTGEFCKISHIGSTAVKTIRAKPTVDILVETTPDSDWAAVKDKLLQGGYLCMLENSRQISFNKGYTENGFAEKVYHLHLRREGDNDELYFRDYLLDHL